MSVTRLFWPPQPYVNLDLLDTVPVSVNWTPREKVPDLKGRNVMLAYSPFLNRDQNTRWGSDWSLYFNNLEKQLDTFVELPVKWIFFDLEHWTGRDARTDLVKQMFAERWPWAMTISYNDKGVIAAGSDYITPDYGLNCDRNVLPLYFEDWGVNSEIWRTRRAVNSILGVSIAGYYPREKAGWGKYRENIYPNWLYRAGLEMEHPWAGKQGWPLSGQNLIFFNLDKGWEKGLEIYKQGTVAG